MRTTSTLMWVKLWMALPAVQRGLIFVFGGDPFGAFGGNFTFPERGAGFEVVHQEFRALECILAVPRGGAKIILVTPTGFQ